MARVCCGQRRWLWVVGGGGGGCGFASCSSKSLNERKKEIDRKREKKAWKKNKK